MKKIGILIFILTVRTNMYSQENNDPLSIEILCYNKTINCNDSLPVVLKIRNRSDSSITVYRHLATGPWNQNDLDLNFIVANSSSDTINLKNSFSDVGLIPLKPWHYEKLEKWGTKLVESRISGEYFAQPGTYKICFVYYWKRPQFTGFNIESFKYIKSNWYFVEVKANKK